VTKIKFVVIAMSNKLYLRVTRYFSV